VIESCKYCLTQRHLCPRCEGPVVVRTITEFTPSLGYVSCSVYLCLTMPCENYGHFKLQSDASVVTIVCDKCAKRAENLKKFQSDLETTFKRSL
jgi:hypothetical protein